MPEIFKERIIKHLKHTDYTPLKLAQLAKALAVNPEDYPQFKLAFEELYRAGRVVIGARNLVSLPPLSGQVIGTFRANPKGFGFVTPLEPNSHGDLFISPDATAAAMTGDIVAAKVIKKGRRAGQIRYKGKVVGILERAQNKFVGTLLKQLDGWIVQPDGTALTEPVSVDDVAAKNAREKDKVVVEILSYPTEKYLGRGVIIEVLGRAGQYESEIKSIIRQYHLPDEFDADCLEQARRAAAEFNPEHIGSRDDITEKLIITIDPPDAKDFDDAISLERNRKDNWVLGVHIADVGHFVSHGSPLDTEGKIRGNSVYLPGKTIPMLPEVVELLKDMEMLSRAIEKRRTKNGMIHLDLPETELIMDKSGRVVDARPTDDSYPHTIIEMFMVEANEAVASVLDRVNVGFMRRIHPEPDSLSMKNLSQLIRALGLSLPRTPDRSAIQDLLAAVKGADCSLAVNLLVLRSFEKAQYAPLHIGHFALASSHYCHFTSPIRRYADLMVHRVLDSYLQNQSAPEQDLTEIGKHITFTEQRAEDAEKELTYVLILQMLSSHIGDELDCVVTGLASFGVFVQSRKYGIEGLIRMGDLGADTWKYDAKTQSIIGLHSGHSIRLGRSMKVRIVSVNVPARQLNVSPVEQLTNTALQTKSVKKKKRSKKVRTQKQGKGKK